MNMIAFLIKTPETDEFILLSLKSRIIAALEAEGLEVEFIDEYEEQTPCPHINLSRALNKKHGVCLDCGQILSRS